jgi:import inner membrane translocase subunit TIM17
LVEDLLEELCSGTAEAAASAAAAVSEEQRREVIIMSTPDHAREPCPDRILDDIGGAFSMGAVGGSAWHFIRGMKNSPRGQRLLGGTQAVRINAPRIGGSFAVWGGLFSTFDCTFVYLRQKEDPWNSIGAGAATGGFLSLRAGMKSASRSAIFGGVLLALIEGAGIMLNRVTANLAQPPPMEEMPQVAGAPGGTFAGGPYAGFPGSSPSSQFSQPYTEPQSSEAVAKPETASGSGFFGGWFGGKKEESQSTRSETLDSFDANPPPPTPGFDLK